MFCYMLYNQSNQKVNNTLKSSNRKLKEQLENTADWKSVKKHNPNATRSRGCDDPGLDAPAAPPRGQWVERTMTMKVVLFRITAAQLSPSLNKHETFIKNVRAFDLPERVSFDLIPALKTRQSALKSSVTQTHHSYSSCKASRNKPLSGKPSWQIAESESK